MKIMQTTIALACAGFIAIPAYAQTAAKNRTTPNTATSNGVTFNPDNPTDTKQITFSKKAYIQQIEKNFDRMDTNGDGVIDSQEMAGRNNSNAGARQEFDEDPADTASKKSSSVKPASGKGSGSTLSPLKSIPPVNSKDLR